MSADPNRKTLRHFYCRDTLWQSFERMSEDLDRGVDDLVNEAMRVLARDKGYLPTESEGPRSTSSRPAPPPPPQPRRPTPPPPPPPRGAATNTLQRDRGGPAYLPAPSSSDFVSPGSGDLPAHVAHGSGAEAPAPPLYLLFQSQKYLVDKEQFIIGRGSKSSDLPIRDGNISRKHAAVVRRSGSYFIKDLGSTNGIDYNGVRIDNKRIEEGDVFNICDYELRFTYR
jgi:pSer/pThr/pTyr-binding forkhead associated (FHA) protein